MASGDDLSSDSVVLRLLLDRPHVLELPRHLSTLQRSLPENGITLGAGVRSFGVPNLSGP